MKKILILLLLSGTTSFSQENPKEKIWSGNFDLGINLTKNTQKTFQLENRFLVNYKRNNHVFSLKNNTSFISNTGTNELLNKGDQNLIYKLSLKDVDCRINFEHLYDITREIKNRYTTGGGLFYNITKKPKHQLGVGSSFLKENEVSTKNEKKLKNRLNGEINISSKLSHNIILNSINQYQPEIRNFGNFRIKTHIGLKVNVSQKLAISINCTINYESYPALNIPEIDYHLNNSISYLF